MFHSAFRWTRDARITPVRALSCIAATLGAIGSAWPAPQLAGSGPVSLVPAAVMLLVLLQGWRTAALAAALVAGSALLLGLEAKWQLAMLGAVSILCGEALRLGVRPVYVTLVQVVAYLIGAAPALQAGHTVTEPALLAAAGVQGGASVAFATAALMLMPRGASRRCRTRWDHMVFCVTVGIPSVALLAILVWPASAAGAGTTGDLPLRLTAVVALSLLANVLLSRKLERMVPGQRNRLVPAQLAGYLARTRREWLRTRRAGRRLGVMARDARQQADMARRELVMLREKLRQDTQQLETARRRAEMLRAQFQAINDSSRDVHIIASDAGIIEFVGGPSATLLGHAPASLAGKKLAELVPVDCILDHPLDLGGHRQFEQPSGVLACQVRKADRSQREITACTHPFTIGGERRYAICLHEPDRMQNALATLEQAEDLKRSATQSRDQFIATMSHELRTPLHGLIATLDMLRGEEMSPDLQHHLAIARTSGRALLKIANDVLDLSRLGSNLFPLERRLFGLRAVLREVVEEVEARAQSVGLAVAVDIIDPLPPSFWGDPARLRQILGNLVSNALKFTAHGGVTLHIRYHAGLCTIDVEDTGEGIPAEKRESIFEPFVQLRTRAVQRVGGTGLGLPISRRIAEAAGGQLVLLRSGAQGSTFRLTLPLEASQEEPPDEQSQRVFTNPHGRILVVEDNPANRYVAEALLASLECPATIVESGREALQLLRDQEFDLILMDCQMPDMDGYETTRQVRRLLKRRIPIIAMTANAMAEDRTECLAAGMDDFLPKPFGRQNLSEQLSKWLQPGNNRNPDLATAARGTGLMPDLDDKVLDELWENLNWQHAPLQRIVTSFSTTLESVAAALDGDPSADLRTLLRHVHSVLGSAGMIGARQIEFLAGRIQAALKAGQHGELRGAAEMLRRAMLRYERELEQKLENRQGERAAGGSGAA